MKIPVLTAVFAATLFCGVSLAQEPEVDIDKGRHPNLYEAQRLVVEASHYVAVAQKDTGMAWEATPTRPGNSWSS